MATSTAAAAAERARSPWVKPIVEVLTSKRKNSWTGIAELQKAAMGEVPDKQALVVTALRADHVKGRANRVKRGKELQVMLALITLKQHGKVEKRGKGATAEFRWIHD